MALQEFDPALEGNQKERILIYAESGMGKTRFGLSVPDPWGEIIYFAADENSRFLQSIPPDMRKRIHVLIPKGDDVIQNFNEFCIRDWRKVYPKAGVLVVDTYTKIGRDTIRHSANTGAVTAEKHYKIGDVANGGQVIPNRGDYQAIDTQSAGYIDNLYQFQAHYHIILICHEDMKQLDDGTVIGGPAFPGRQVAAELPGKVSTVIRLIRKGVLDPMTSAVTYRVFAVTTHSGKFMAKLRECGAGGNPIPEVMLDIMPKAWWTMYDKLFETTPSGEALGTPEAV